MDILHKFASTTLRAAFAGALVVCAPAAFVVSTAPASAQGANTLDQAVSALRGISTMQADFTQSSRNGQSVNGKLTLKRPGRIRFEYDKSVNMLVVSNGSRVTFIDYDVSQLQSWPISNSPLGALLDPNRDVKRYGRIVPTTNPNVLSIEVKDSSKPEYGTLTMVFVRNASAPGGLELASWVALDAQNNRTTVRLSNHRYGMTVADSTFTYRDPRRTTRRPR